MKRAALVFALVFALIPSQSLAATKSPTPTPSSKPTAQATSKATPTAKSTPTKKATTSAKPTATKKATPTKKAPAKKKKKSLAPSPPPKWPPAGYKVMDDIYYRTPSVEIMMNVAAGNISLAKAVAACKEFSCGRLQVASLIGCVYWEIESKVITPNPDIAGSFLTMGMLRTLAKKSLPKEIVTLVLPSGELYSGTIAVVPTSITCHQDATTETVPSNTYIRR
ncbi:MAG: hypothetical protein ACKOPU_00425 [Candidatus Planktophila sp.]